MTQDLVEAGVGGEIAVGGIIKRDLLKLRYLEPGHVADVRFYGLDSDKGLQQRAHVAVEGRPGGNAVHDCLQMRRFLLDLFADNGKLHEKLLLAGLQGRKKAPVHGQLLFLLPK